MNRTNSIRPFNKPYARRRGAFTLLELLVVMALIGILAGILLPALSKARDRAHAIFSLNNTRQLTTAWVLYSDDHNGRLVYNLGGISTRLYNNPNRVHDNWVNSYLDWEKDNTDNTNVITVTDGALGIYTARAAQVYRCPSDDALHAAQERAGWNHRVRSYSMNAMVGDAGEITKTGSNTNNPGYVQFFNLSSIPEPGEVFVFIEEHPDSIDDGYFINRAGTYTHIPRWDSLPASHHNGAAAISFADGHAELHQWKCKSTERPESPDAAGLPFDVPKTETDYLADYNWVIKHMSVNRH